MYGGKRSYGPQYNGGRKGLGNRNRSPYAKAAFGGAGGMGTKVNISNLDSEVTDGDVREIFQQVGRVIGAAVNYDRHGRSRGTAEITFANRRDALRAVQEYDRAEVDGRPMYLSVSGGVSAMSAKIPIHQRVQRVPQGGRSFGRQVDRAGGRSFNNRRGNRGNRGNQDNRRGDNRRSNNRGGDNRRNNKPQKSAEQLDKELDDYHNKSGSGSSTGFTGQPSGFTGQPSGFTGQPSVPE